MIYRTNINKTTLDTQGDTSGNNYHDVRMLVMHEEGSLLIPVLLCARHSCCERCAQFCSLHDRLKLTFDRS